MVKLICVVATHICLSWKMYWYIAFSVFNVNYVDNTQTTLQSNDIQGLAGVFVANFTCVCLIDIVVERKKVQIASFPNRAITI